MPPGLSLSDFYYILPEIVLTTAALVLLVADVMLPRGSRLLAWVTLAGLAATLLSMIPLVNAQVEVSNGLIAVDKFAFFFKVIFLIAAALTVLMSVRYLEVEGASPGEYYFLIMC
jgi:NADH-quinone oxidoreductase subunit N